MLFKYTAVDTTGHEQEGAIEAVSEDAAISALQRRGLIISAITSGEPKALLRSFKLPFMESVSNREIVILSRQIAILFEGQVSALRVFRLIASESENPTLQIALSKISDDIQAGDNISKAMAKHPQVFSSFYVSMVRAGEESGKLDQTFSYLADYLDRTYEITNKAKNALTYPAFIITTFFAVMFLMLTFVIPRLAQIIEESGTEVPLYTTVVLAISGVFARYGIVIVVFMIVGAGFLWRYLKTPNGRTWLDALKIGIPYIGGLYEKLYLSRIADNMSTMLSAGIPMVRTIEVTADVVENMIYQRVLIESLSEIKNGTSISKAFGKYPEMPGIFVQMIRVGEETGELGNILGTLAKFYGREVKNAVDSLVALIEPVMIVFLGLGVGLLLGSVLVPIYNITTSVS